VVTTPKFELTSASRLEIQENWWIHR